MKSGMQILIGTAFLGLILITLVAIRGIGEPETSVPHTLADDVEPPRPIPKKQTNTSKIKTKDPKRQIETTEVTTTITTTAQQPQQVSLVPFEFKKPSTAKLVELPGSRYVPIYSPPVGAGHNVEGEENFPLYGDDIDDATRIFEAIPSIKIESNNPYDHPEDADKNAKPGSIWQELIANYKNAPASKLFRTNESAMCLIFSVYTGNCKYLDESLEQCVQRVGFNRLDDHMSEKCRISDIWRKLGSERDKTPTEPDAPLYFGKVVESETCTTNRPDPPYVEPDQRTPAPFGGPRHCKNGALQYPIAFGTPSTQVHTKLFPKLFDFHPIPLDVPPKPLLWNDEETYQALATMSYFCMTNSRGGWDCGRHYEVMGAGCIPYFIDIHAAGPYILPHMPRKFFQDIVKMPIFSHIGYIPGANRDSYIVPQSPYYVNGHFNYRTRIKFVNESFYFSQGVPLDQKWYWDSARRLLKYSQDFMTTESMVAYVLKTMGIENAKRVLIISRDDWDNLHQAFMTGLDGLGIVTTTVMTKNLKLQHCFEHPPDKPFTNQELCTKRSDIFRGGVHGNGVPWANRLRHRGHTFVPHIHHLWHRIESGYYDAAIFTYYFEDSFPFPHVSALKASTKGKVAFMDHSDTMEDPRRNSQYLSKEVYFFSRELRRAYC